MKRAFGLPQAIMIILFIGSIVLISMKYARVSTEHYSDTYVKEQAELFLQSAKEWALLQISGFDRQANGRCWSGGVIKLSDMVTNIKRDFNATITAERYYLFDTPDPNDDFDTCTTLRDEIQTPESHGMVTLNIVVQDNQNEIRIVNRSIQRP